MEPILTIRELSKYLRLDPQTVSRKAQRGEIPGIKIGNRWRFRREAIESWLNQGHEPRHRQDLADLFKRVPEVLVVYLFGSRARGDATGESDTDLAVLFRKGGGRREQDEKLSKTGRELSERCDLVYLNQAASLLKYEVISDGRIVFKRMSDEELARFEL